MAKRACRNVAGFQPSGEWQDWQPLLIPGAWADGMEWQAWHCTDDAAKTPPAWHDAQAAAL